MRSVAWPRKARIVLSLLFLVLTAFLFLDPVQFIPVSLTKAITWTSVYTFAAEVSCYGKPCGYRIPSVCPAYISVWSSVLLYGLSAWFAFRILFRALPDIYASASHCGLPAHGICSGIPYW